MNAEVADVELEDGVLGEPPEVPDDVWQRALGEAFAADLDVDGDTLAHLVPDSNEPDVTGADGVEADADPFDLEDETESFDHEALDASDNLVDGDGTDEVDLADVFDSLDDGAAPLGDADLA